MDFKKKEVKKNIYVRINIDKYFINNLLDFYLFISKFQIFK